MNMSDVPVALLAGGLATRLRPITATIPKALVEVAGRPFIDHQLSLLERRGVRRVVLCLGYLGEQVQQHLGSRYHEIELDYVFDGDSLLGTGGAIRKAAPLLGDVFWVMYGDSYMNIEYAEILQRFASSGASALMTVIENRDRWDRSNVVFRDGKLEIYNKRQPNDAMRHIDYGASLLRRSVINRMNSDPADLADLYSSLVAEGEMIGYEVSRRFYEIGSPEGLAETRAYLSRLFAA